MKIFVDENRLFEEIGEMLKKRQNRTNVIKEKLNIKYSVSYYVTCNLLNWYGHLQRMGKERIPKTKVMMPRQKKQKKKRELRKDLEIC